MVGIQPNTTLIGHLRIRSRSSDPQAERQRISRMLSSATLHPAGLPETAMLIVRRLADPLPSRLRAGPLDLVPDASWERAVTGALENLAASAARPAYGPVPAESNAVLFYDRAEVLASLALDWMSGTLPVQWWWREILRGRDAITALLREWIEAPQYVPGALGLLGQRKEAVKFVQWLPHPAVAEILKAVVRSYNLPQPEIEDPAPAHHPEERLALSIRLPKAEAQKQMLAAHATASRWTPEAFTPVLSAIHTVLLVQALMLRRAPAVARTTAFQKELRRWHRLTYYLAEIGAVESGDGHDVLHEPQQGKLATAEMPSMLRVEEEKIGTAQAEIFTQDAREQLPVEARGTERGAMAGKEETNTPARLASPSVAQSAPPAKHADADAPEGEPELKVVEQAISALELENLPEALPGMVKPEPVSEPSIRFETEYAGVFFLLSLALYLYIYGDFTSPTEPGLELNIWDFLAMMGSELTDGAIEQDPLWERLALLAGRSKGRRPGLDFDPPDEWHLPPEWLEPFPEPYDAQPVLANGRMISRHPAGFAVLDMPVDTRASGRAQPSEPQAERLKRWTKWISSYFRARLLRALGRKDAVDLMCGRPGEVVLTVTHVDVFFSLDHHPIELRMAGLDRDLGWIPAAGRYVAFHFR